MAYTKNTAATEREINKQQIDQGTLQLKQDANALNIENVQ